MDQTADDEDEGYIADLGEGSTHPVDILVLEKVIVTHSSYKLIRVGPIHPTG